MVAPKTRSRSGRARAGLSERTTSLPDARDGASCVGGVCGGGVSVSTTSEGEHEREALFMLLARAGRAIFEKVEHAVAGQGESVVMFRPLAIVVRFGPQTQQDIAKLTAQHPAGVSRVVDELEERGLVRRVRGEHDRRTVRVEPTEKGLALFSKINPIAMSALDAALGTLDARDREAFVRALERIVLANGT
jgi:MarR family 2-MHQ and catechol resistance regulon transcriptional repressor